MKFIYTKPILEQLLDGRTAALKDRKEIDRVELSLKEAHRLYDETRFSLANSIVPFPQVGDEYRIFGLNVRVVK